MPHTSASIYHITHVENLPKIVTAGLLSDAATGSAGGPGVAIGMPRIKQRRLTEIKVPCHPGTFVGHYVPFYFCPRSVMLFLFHRNNHVDLTYRGGQQPIVHLEMRIADVVQWAGVQGARWAFSLSNAGASYVQFRNDLADLGDLDWSAIEATNWQGRQEAKQAEFLVEGPVPWHLVRRVGVISSAVGAKVEETCRSGPPLPTIEVRPDWYY